MVKLLGTNRQELKGFANISGAYFKPTSKGDGFSLFITGKNGTGMYQFRSKTSLMNFVLLADKPDFSPSIHAMNLRGRYLADTKGIAFTPKIDTPAAATREIPVAKINSAIEGIKKEKALAKLKAALGTRNFNLAVKGGVINL